MGARKGSNNGGGRSAVPASLIDNSKTRCENSILSERLKVEESLMVPSELEHPPKGMSFRAKREWKRVIDLYKQMDITILCGLDKAILRMYCEAVGTYELASDVVNQTQKNAKDANKPFYMVAVDYELKKMDSSAKIIKGLAEQLCLSPLARARMGVALSGQNSSKDDKKPLDDLFDDDDNR